MVTLKITFSRVLKINAWEELNIFIKILTLYQKPFADFIFYLAFLCNHLTRNPRHLHKHLNIILGLKNHNQPLDGVRVPRFLISP